MAARRRQVRVLVFDTLPGLAIGVAVSGVSFVYRASHPDIAELSKVRATAELFAERERHPVNEPVDGITILRVEGGLFVANADVVRGRVVETRPSPVSPR